MIQFRIYIWTILIACVYCQSDDDYSGIPGHAGKDFPVFSSVPSSDFNCDSQPVQGYFSDSASSCQGFHVCHRGKNVGSFLCPNGTLFHQKELVCNWWYDVDCSQAPAHYISSNQKVEQAAKEVDLRNLALQMQKSGYDKLSNTNRQPFSDRGGFDGYPPFSNRFSNNQNQGYPGFSGNAPYNQGTSGGFNNNQRKDGFRGTYNSIPFNQKSPDKFSGITTPNPYQFSSPSLSTTPSIFSQNRGITSDGYSPINRNQNQLSTTFSPLNNFNQNQGFTPTPGGYTSNQGYPSGFRGTSSGQNYPSTQSGYSSTLKPFDKNQGFGGTFPGLSQNQAKSSIPSRFSGLDQKPEYPSSSGGIPGYNQNQRYPSGSGYTDLKQNQGYPSFPSGYSSTSRPTDLNRNQDYPASGISSSGLRPTSPGYPSTTRPFDSSQNQRYPSYPSGYSSTSRPTDLNRNQGYPASEISSSGLRPTSPGYSSTSRPFDSSRNQGYPSYPSGYSSTSRPTDLNRNQGSGISSSQPRPTSPGYSSTSRPYDSSRNQGYPSSPNLKQNQGFSSYPSGYTSTSTPDLNRNQGYPNLRASTPGLPSSTPSVFSSTSRPSGFSTGPGRIPSPGSTFSGYPPTSKPADLNQNQVYPSSGISSPGLRLSSPTGYTRPLDLNQGFSPFSGKKQDYPTVPGYASISSPKSSTQNRGYPTGPGRNLSPNKGYSSTLRPADINRNQGYPPTGSSPGFLQNQDSSPGSRIPSEVNRNLGYPSPGISSPGSVSLSPNSSPLNFKQNQGYPSGEVVNSQFPGLKQTQGFSPAPSGFTGPSASSTSSPNLSQNKEGLSNFRKNQNIPQTPGGFSTTQNPNLKQNKGYPSTSGNYPSISDLKQNQGYPGPVTQNRNQPTTPISFKQRQGNQGFSTTSSPLNKFSNQGYPNSNLGQNLNACIAPGFNNIDSYRNPRTQFPQGEKFSPYGYNYPKPSNDNDAVVVEAAVGPRGSQGRPGVNALLEGLNSVHKAGDALGKSGEGYHYDKPKIPFNEGK